MSTPQPAGTSLARRTSCLHLVAALVVVTASSTAMAQHGWVRQSPLPYQPLDAQSVAFASPTHGYIVGSDIVMDAATSDDDFLLETHDGGLTWTQLHPPGTQENFRCIFFVDELHGWVVGNMSASGFINDNFRTVDGGLSWQQMQLAPGTWGTVHFLNPDFGWAKQNGGPPALSTDGGLTWTFPIVMIEGNASFLATVRFANTQLGIAMTGGGIFRTTDGGVSWTHVLSGDF